MALTRDAAWWPRLDAAFQGALELPSGERASYLDRVCGTDTELRAEVAAMLAADAPEYTLGIERLVCDVEALPLDPDPFIGMRLGPWRVVDLVGHGGMGTVYLGERADGQYEQRVAIKLVRGAAHHSPGSTRFKAETYILARLSHPNIARVIDAGHTPEGSAYLVMEYIDGTAVTAHCDAHQLTVDERLRLFRVVCDATQHAHQSLIVHRDLKPSNIFVSGAGEVKLLDFGIAKLLEPDHPFADQTTPEMRALTPAYAAPEQIRGDPVTTAADVYVLGAVLYELLTGHRPAGHEAAHSAALDVPLVPPAPSLAVRRRLTGKDDGARAAVAAVAAARRTSPARLARHLAGDINRVVLKALQPEPERRYGSAGQLADDLQRLLDGRPVVAQPDTLAYRTRRFIARHRVGMAMASALVALVVSFAVVAAMQARAVAVERDRARVEARRAQRVSVLVTDLFKLAEPAVGRGDTITAHELLDRGSHRIDMELQGDPETQAALFNALARVYGNLGLHAAAIGVLQRALDLEPATAGGGTLARAETLHLLAERHASLNDYATADRQFREALALRRTLRAPGADIAATLDGLGQLLNASGKYAAARARLEEAVAIRRSLPGASASELMSGLYQLGLLVHFEGLKHSEADVGRAERLFREAVAVGARIPGPSPEKVTSIRRHAELVSAFNHAPAKAEPLWREALAMARTIYPGDHQEVLTCLGELSHNLLRLGKLAEAEPFAREGAAMAHRLYGDRHDETLRARLDLARVLRAERKLDEAERLLRAALPQSRSLLGDGNPTTIITARGLATVLEEQRRFREALLVRQDELARTARVLGEHDVFVATGLTGLGEHGLARGRFDLAETYFMQALDVRRALHPPDHWRIDEARGLVGVARLQAGRLAEAEADLLAAYEGLRAHRGPTASETAAVRTHLVELLRALEPARPGPAISQRSALIPLDRRVVAARERLPPLLRRDMTVSCPHSLAHVAITDRAATNGPLLGGGLEESDMITRRTVFAGFTGALVMSAGIATPPALATGSPAGAVQSCWDFSTLPQFPVGTKYFIGDVFIAPTATIEMKHYVMNGNKVNSPAAQAYAQSSQIAGGPAPEFRMYLINAHVEPNNPVNSVSFDFGLFALAGNVHANIGANGELVEVTTTLLDLNGRVLGDPAVGTVQVIVNMVTPPGASPEKGTLTLVALTGQIEKWTVGGRQLFIDNVCM